MTTFLSRVLEIPVKNLDLLVPGLSKQKRGTTLLEYGQKCLFAKRYVLRPRRSQ